LAVATPSQELYARQGWQAEVETHYKALAPLTEDAEPSAEDDGPCLAVQRRARSRKLGTFARRIANPSANTTNATASARRTDSAKLAMPNVTPNADR
jgi:hypothetical protein